MGLINRTKILVFSLVAVALIFQGCPKSTQGHLTGVQKRMVWSHPHPYGMGKHSNWYIPHGSK